MKIVLCQINSKYVHSPLAPWCLLAGIKKYCKNSFDSKIIEGTINEQTCDIVSRIYDEKPDIIGLSCYIWNIDAVKYAGESLRKLLPDSKIVIGGPEVSYNQCEALKLYSWTDYVISGEGEKPFALLCDSICEKRLCDAPGVSYAGSDGVHVSDPFIDNEDPPSPYCDEYFKMLKGRICYLETSRGCPYRCAFCLSGRCGGARFFDLERSLNDAVSLAQSGSTTIKLVDRTFNANRERAKKFWRFIISEHGKKIPDNVCFHFEIAGDILDDESLEILSSAPKGSMQLEIGLQSFNEKTLSYINRKTDTERLCRNIERLMSFKNMHVHIDLIAGLPFEDMRSFRESFNKAYNLKPDMLQLGFLKLLHGADMKEDTERYPCEYNRSAPYEIVSNEWMSHSELLSLHYCEDALERLYNSSRFRKTLEYIFSETGMEPFDFFFEFGGWVKDRMDYRIDLDSYTSLLYEFATHHLNIGEDRVCDVLIIDRLASSSSGKLPEFLKFKRNIIRKVRVACESDERYIRKKGVKRGFALLRSSDDAVICDYVNKDPITGRYDYVIVPYGSNLELL